jgi:hypothetical protein
VALAAPVSTKKLSRPSISPEQAGTPRISGKGRNACPDRLTNDLPAPWLWVVAFQIFDTFAARVWHATLANLSLTSRFLKPELCTGRCRLRIGAQLVTGSLRAPLRREF